MDKQNSYSLNAHKAAILAEVARLKKVLTGIENTPDGPERAAALAAFDRDFDILQKSQREYRLNAYVFGAHPDYRW